MGSSTDNTTHEWREEISARLRGLLGMIRWMAVGLTAGTRWQAIGHILLDNRTRETINVDVFSGIGFYARPKAGIKADMLVAFPGGAPNPVVVASRDEETRAKVAAIDQDETKMYNTLVGITATKDGKLFACSHGGTPVELAKASELNNLRAFVMQQFVPAGHTHAVSGSATTTVASIVTPVTAPTGAYPGTSRLKGE